MIDIEYCGTPWRWRWIHRLGSLLSILAFVMALTSALGYNVIVAPDKTGIATLTWSLVTLSLGIALMSVSSFFYQRVVVKQ